MGRRAVTGMFCLIAACGGGDDDGDPMIDPADVIGSIGMRYAGTRVTLLSPIADEEGLLLTQAYQPFIDGTGIEIEYQVAPSEDHLFERIAAGDAPDLAVLPQPGALADLAAQDALVARDDLAALVDASYVAGWRALGSVDGTLYALPFSAQVKSLLWYSPSRFAERGYTVPATWDELLELSDQIVADGGTPWCVGMASGGATGWVGTDWIEDLMLRTAGPDVYDDWVAHAIPFDHPAVVAAFDEAARVLKNESYILGGVAAQLEVSFFDAAFPLIDGDCWLHRQATFVAGAFEGSVIGPDGDVDVVYFPSLTAADRPVLGGGDVIASFADRPEVEAALLYLASAQFANARAQEGGWLSPHKGLDLSEVDDPVIAAAGALLQEATAFRYDGSDLMPFEVGAGTFWSGVVDWIGGKSSAEVAAEIEASWPN